MLPQAFMDRMKLLLQEEYEAFIQSYTGKRFYGLRYNPLKIEQSDFEERMPFTLEPVPWAKEGYYYQEEERPGRHLFHEAGAYYIQEPSAMAVVEALDPQPGEFVLDLCAAPGGKSTQIAGRLLGQGLLVSNEIMPARCKVLSQNVERMGVRNCIVLNEDSNKMSLFFPAFFDRIVVDAPCSGEGMFRKDQTAVEEWSPENVQKCAQRQDMILQNAAKMLKPGGLLVYSTCTFAPDENEGTIARFLANPDHKGFCIEPTGESYKPEYFTPGQPEWVDAFQEKNQIQMEDMKLTARLWPHRLKGEGHFMALLRKPGSRTISILPEGVTGDKKLLKEAEIFLKKELNLSLQSFQGNVVQFGDHITLMPAGISSIKGLKVEKPGVHIALVKKNRWEPDHAFAMSMSLEQLKEQSCSQVVTISLEQGERYLRGEGIYLEQDNEAIAQGITGWCFVVCQGFVLGFGKLVGSQLKNHYPKGLRKN